MAFSTRSTRSFKKSIRADFFNTSALRSQKRRRSGPKLYKRANMVYTMLYIMLYTMLHTMLYIMLYTMLYTIYALYYACSTLYILYALL